MSPPEWFFRSREEVFGPFDIDTMRGFRRSGLLKAESEVSLLTFPGRWIPAKETEIFRDSSSNAMPSVVPVPAMPAAADDRFAWSLAVAALALSVIEAQAFRLGISPFYEEWYIAWGWLTYILLNGLLAGADIGHNRVFLMGQQVLLSLIVPVYFWVRQRKTRSSSAILLVNLAAFALSLAVTFGKIPIVGGTNLNSCFSSGLQKTVTDLVQSPSFMLHDRVAMIRSVREINYDGRTRVCLAEIITAANRRRPIEFSTETTEKGGEEYVRVRAVD